MKISLIFKTIEIDAENGSKKVIGIAKTEIKELISLFSKKTKIPFDVGININYDEIEEIFDSINAGTYDDAKIQTLSSSMQEYIGATEKGKLSVDDYILSEKKKCVALQASGASTRQLKMLLDEYNNGCKSSGLSQSEFTSAVYSTNKSFGNYLSSLNGAQGSLGGYILYCTKAAVKTAALNVAVAGMNMLFTAGLSFAISAIISKFREWYVSAEELADKVDDLTKTYEDQKRTLRDTKKTLGEIAPRYQELSKGVDDLGRNVSLSTDEYAEYKEIVGQIKDMFPDMVKGYSDEGDAILYCKGNVEELTRTYEEMAIAANNAILASGDDVFKNFKNANKKFNNKSNALNTSEFNALNEILNSTDIDAAISQTASEHIGIAKVLRDNGFEQILTLWDSETNSEFIKRCISENRVLVQQIVGEFNKSVQEEVDKVQNLAEAYLGNALMTRGADGNKLYGNISDSMGKVIENIIGMMDYDFISQFEDKFEMYEYIDSVLDAFDGLDVDSQVKLDALFGIQTKMNNGECTVGDYLAAISNAKSVISAFDEDTQMKLNVILGLDDGGFESQYQTLLDKLIGYGMNSDAASKWINSLNAEQFERAVRFASNATPEFDAEGFNLDLFIEQIESWNKAVESAEKLDFSELIADTDSDTDFVDQIGALKDEASDLQDALDKIRDGETIDTSSLFELFPELAEEEDLEKGISDLLALKAEEVEKIFGDYYEQLDTSVEGNVIAFEAYKAAVLALFDTTREGIPVFASLTEAMEGVDSASNMLGNIREEMATDGFISGASLQTLTKQFGEDIGQYVTFDNGKPIAKIEEIRDFYIKAIQDMGIETEGLEDAMISWLDSGFDESEFNFNELTEAMGKVQSIASIAAAAQKDLAQDQVESMREIFGEDYEKYIEFDADGNYEKVNVTALKEYSRELLVTKGASSALLTEFDAMWDAALAGTQEAETALDRVSQALSNISSVSDYLTLLESDDLSFVDALSSAVKLLEEMGDGYSLEDFFTFGEDGSIEYHTQFLTTWLDGYLNKMVTAGDITQKYADQMKAAAKAESQQENKLEKLKDAINGVTKASDLMKDAQEEVAETGSNSLDTLLSLYEQFGDKANDMLKVTEDGGLVIDTDAIKAEMLKTINEIDGIAPEIRTKLEEALNVKPTDDEFFKAQIDAHVEKVKSLQDALSNLRDNGLSESDIYDLAKEFPELTTKTGNLEEAIIDLLNSMNADVVGLFAKQFGKVDSAEDRKELQAFMDIVLKLGEVVGNTKFAIDIAAEAEGVEQLFDAIKESVSSTGLSSESIDNLHKRYEKLDSFNPAKLFEKTANGIHLNTSALRKLENEYEKLTKKNIDDSLDSLIAEYNSLTEQIDKAGIAAGTTDLYARRNDILNQINETSELAAQYAGLTSAFYKWEQAQSMGEEGDMYDSLTGGLKDIKELYKEGLVGTNKFRTAVQLMSDDDLSNATIDQLMDAYDEGYPKMQRYFQDSSDGVLHFLNDLKDLNSEWVTLNKDGSWDINFGIGNDQEIAKELGINVEAVQAIMRKLSDYGFDINLDSVYTDLDTMTTKAEKAAEKLKEMGKTDYSFNVGATNIDRLDEQIVEAGKILDQFKNADGTVNLSLEGAEEAQYLMASLIMQKQSLDKPSILKIDASNVDGDIGEVIRKLQDIYTKYNYMEVQAAIGADTTALQADIDAAIADLSATNPEIVASLGIDESSQAAFISTVSSITPEVMVECGVDKTEITNLQQGEYDATGTVTYAVDRAAVDTFEAEQRAIEGTATYTPVTEAVTTFETESHDLTPNVTYNVVRTAVDDFKSESHDDEATVTYDVNDAAVDGYTPSSKYAKVYYSAYMYSWTPPTKYGTVYYTVKTRGSTSVAVDGTTHAHGTAYAHGDWGTKNSGYALGGELGQELVVLRCHHIQ